MQKPKEQELGKIWHALNNRFKGEWKNKMYVSYSILINFNAMQ